MTIADRHESGRFPKPPGSVVARMPGLFHILLAARVCRVQSVAASRCGGPRAMARSGFLNNTAPGCSWSSCAVDWGQVKWIPVDADVFASSRRVRNRPVFLLWDHLHFRLLRRATAELAGPRNEISEDGIARISKGAREVSDSARQSDRRHQETIGERRIFGRRPNRAR
jgi:hypothetical protein